MHINMKFPEPTGNPPPILPPRTTHRTRRRRRLRYRRGVPEAAKRRPHRRLLRRPEVRYRRRSRGTEASARARFNTSCSDSRPDGGVCGRGGERAEEFGDR